MSKGTLSTIEYLTHKILVRRITKWYDAFYDHHTGGFYERLGKGFQPIYTGQRRLVTQCRQLSIYSHASIQKECASFSPDLNIHFDYIVEKYHCEKTGIWRFSTNDEGHPLNNESDLYALAFVIFSFSHYYRATKNQRAKELALSTLKFIRNNFKKPDLPGYQESINENLNPISRTRRQNPHMHLLEASLFAWETWQDPAYLDEARHMISLMEQYFFDPEKPFLGEYYSEDLSRAKKDGTLAEPGHYFEWVWLLKIYERASSKPGLHNKTCNALLSFANAHGWDETHGGIYDEFSIEGTITKDSKRLWPFTEALKANALMLDSGTDKDFLKQRMSDMIRLFEKRYMDERGFWTEWLKRDFTPATDYMPGTTPYHVYFGLIETRAALRTRGKTKSLFTPQKIAAYSLRRKLSSLNKTLKTGIKG